MIVEVKPGVKIDDSCVKTDPEEIKAILERIAEIARKDRERAV